MGSEMCIRDRGRNEYLNDYPNSCSTGSFDVRVSQEDRDGSYRHTSPSNNYNDYDDNRRIEFTYRKYLGSACTDEFKEVQQENMHLKQQLELMKMCGKVNNNPTLQRNPSFALLVEKCSGIIIPENKKPEGSYWDDLKDNYKKENPKSYSLIYKLTVLTTHINILHCHQLLFLVLENDQWMRF